MNTYLPIANITANFLVLLSLGALSGFLSGVYGIGGGIISTPIMIFFGIPSNVVVGTASFQLLGSAVSGTMRNAIKKNIDFKATGIMSIGGLVGSSIGTSILNKAAKQSADDLVVSIMFIVVMSVVLFPMISEIIRTLVSRSRFSAKRMRHLEVVVRRRLMGHSGKPFMIYSSIGQIEYNIFGMILIGFIVGICSGMMGVGGGVISIPIMTYFMGIPFKVASGIALLQVAIMSISNLAWQVKAGNVDIILGMILLLSSTFTVQLGSFVQSKARSMQLKATFAMLLATMLSIFLVRLYGQPADLLMVGR